jgi:protein tyrosine/serine phosphatase
VLALSLATPAVAQTARTSALSNIRIDNFGQVNASYYRGAQPVGRDWADLAALGVKTVIDLQQDGSASEAGFVQKAGMKFFRIPMTTRVPPTTAQLEQFLTLVNDPANQPVFVHCAGGRHRTGIMTAVYRMTDAGWTPDQAFTEMKQYNFGPDFLHPEFKRFVFTYRAQPKPTLTPNIVAVTVAGQ